jgi:hypothetical protein
LVPGAVSSLNEPTTHPQVPHCVDLTGIPPRTTNPQKLRSLRTYLDHSLETQLKRKGSSGGNVSGLDDHYEVEWVHGDESRHSRMDFWESRGLIPVRLVDWKR